MISRHKDWLDAAAERTQVETDKSIAAQRALVQGAGSDECEDCGCEIPADRRAAAPWAVRCIHCQEIEDGKKGVRRG